MCCCGWYSGFNGDPVRASSLVTSSLIVVFVPIPTLKNSSEAPSALSASTLHRATSETWTKSYVWLPSPWMTGGSPCSIRSSTFMMTLT